MFQRTLGHKFNWLSIQQSIFLQINAYRTLQIWPSSASILNVSLVLLVPLEQDNTWLYIISANMAAYMAHPEKLIFTQKI